MNTSVPQTLPATAMEPALQLFADCCMDGESGIGWTAAEQASWQRITDMLLLDASEHTVLVDLVVLLRDPAFDGDEVQEIDTAVRWWDAARRAGLPVDADFGACWRACEWQGLLHDLAAMGRACQARQSAARDNPRDNPQADPPARLPTTPDQQRRLARASRVALRYGQLKPLLRLLEPLSGARVQAGFTF